MTFTEGSNSTLAKANTTPVADFDVKARFGQDIRRFKLPSDVRLGQLQAHVRALFSVALQSTFVMLYQDDENDLVTMTLDEELKYAVSKIDGLLRLEVRIEGQGPVPASIPTDTKPRKKLNKECHRADLGIEQPSARGEKAGRGRHCARPAPGAQAPVPEAPVPEAPVPEAPVPEAPVPEAPVPEAPVPEAPVPEDSTPEAQAPAPVQAEAEGEETSLGLRECFDMLEARHVEDITVADGTVVQPGVPFTKTLRARNAGAVNRPEKTIVPYKLARDRSCPKKTSHVLSVPSDYEQLVKQIQDMGFADIPTRRIQYLLGKFEGNVDPVVAKLNVRRENANKNKEGGRGNKKH